MKLGDRSFLRPAPQHLPGIRSALQGAGLPGDDLTADHLPDFLIAIDSSGAVTHCAGLERFGDVGLLRSVLVAPEFRRESHGARLLAAIEQYAWKSGVRTVYLLTTTAAPFFERRGYSSCERDRAPEALRGTAEFTSLCPASATCMVKTLPSPVPLS
jgi:amino-acid N-acetyltransferase